MHLEETANIVENVDLKITAYIYKTTPNLFQVICKKFLL